jgi:hypothetical protein
MSQQHFASFLAKTHTKHLIFKRIYERGVENDYMFVLYLFDALVLCLRSREGLFIAPRPPIFVGTFHQKPDLEWCTGPVWCTTGSFDLVAPL